MGASKLDSDSFDGEGVSRILAEHIRAEYYFSFEISREETQEVLEILETEWDLIDRAILSGLARRAERLKFAGDLTRSYKLNVLLGYLVQNCGLAKCLDGRLDD